MKDETNVDSKERAREYQRKYYREHKAVLRERRRKYFLKYYHETLKKNPEAVNRRRKRALKYYYDHKDAIVAKRNKVTQGETNER